MKKINPCMGVPDSTDVGGGISSFSINHNGYINFGLVDITIGEIKKGERSRAINLLNPKFRALISKIIDEYYQQRSSNN